MYRFVIFTLGITLLTLNTHARPISYPGGWTVMQMNDYQDSSLHVHYSPTAKYSVGYYAEKEHGSDMNMHTIQVNNLLKRWNNPKSQANIYLKSGVGAANSDGDWNPAAFTGIAIDWEDRRYFTSYENKISYKGADHKEFVQKARVGIAPYIGDYEDIHTWIMLQADHTPNSQRHDNINVTPLLRFFKGTWLVEVGFSDTDNFMLNWIVRY